MAKFRDPERVCVCVTGWRRDNGRRPAGDAVTGTSNKAQGISTAYLGPAMCVTQVWGTVVPRTWEMLPQFT